MLLYRSLIDSPKRGDTSPFTSNIIKNWIKLIEKTLSLEIFLRAPCVKRHTLKEDVNVQGNQHHNESIFQTSMRKYMLLFKKIVRRTKGERLCLTKFHQNLHLGKYVLEHGVASNFDTSRPEAIGKFLIKDPGKLSQKRAGSLTYQCAMHHCSKKDIRDFKNFIFVRYNDEYHKLHMKSRYEHILQQESNRKENLNKALDFLIDDEILDDNEGAYMTQYLPLSDNKVLLKGSKFELYWDYSYKETCNNDTGQIQTTRIPHTCGMKHRWCSKTIYELFWDDAFLTGLESYLYNSSLNCGTENCRTKSIVGYTEMKFSNGMMIRSHPCYRSSLPWFDTVMIHWVSDDDEEEDNITPARVLMILDLTQVDGGEDFEKDIYIVVQSTKENVSTVSNIECRYSSLFAERLKMEDKFHVIQASSIICPTLLVEDADYTSRGGKVLWNFATHIKKPTEWMDTFQVFH